MAETETIRDVDPMRGVDTMSGSDALLWTISADPVMRPTIVALMVLDRTPDWAEVRSRIAHLTETVPRLRSRAVNRAPGLGRPQFVPDDAFDLSTHLWRMRLPEHGALRDVLDLAQTMATSGFDPALPLWEAVLVEGVGAERAALVMKVHHSLIDGVGGLAVLAHLFDTSGATRQPAAPPEMPSEEAERLSHPQWHRLGDLPDAVRLVDGALDAVIHPFRTFDRVVGLGASVARLMAPAGKPISPIMTGRSFRRHAEVLDLDLPTIKRAASAWGGTVNDVFVASVVRGLILYHDQHGVVSQGFRVLMPVNVRDKDKGGAAGNHFVPARFVIPAHADVADCMAEVRRIADEWKHAPGLGISDVLATALSALPAPVARSLWGSMLLGNDVCVTNIPGPPLPVFLADARVEGIYAVSPPSGAAFNVSLISSADRACVTVTADVAAVPDSPKLAGCIEDGFAEVCSARPPPAGSR
jgi:diacylglycerol O-acyltransferase / wax synthase